MNLYRISIVAVAFALSGCLLERVAPINRQSEAYGAHWIKPAMSVESRRADIAACGAKGGESVNFLPQEIQAEKRPGDPNDIAAYLRLRAQWSQCMRSRGYVYTEACDGRCLAP